MNFSLLYPEILTPETMKPDGWSLTNHWQVSYGSKTEIYKSNTASLTTNFSSDYQKDYRNGTEIISPNYILIARADILAKLSDEVTVSVTGASNSAFTSNIETQSFVYTRESLLGKRQEDLFVDLDPMQDKRFWRVTFQTETSQKHAVGKIFLGKKFDLGVEPTTPLVVNVSRSSQSIARQTRKIYRINFDGVPEDRLSLVTSRIMNANSKSVIAIRSASYVEMFAGESVVIGNLTSLTHSPITINSHQVNFFFAEGI